MTENLTRFFADVKGRVRHVGCHTPVMDANQVTFTPTQYQHKVLSGEYFYFKNKTFFSLQYFGDADHQLSVSLENIHQGRKL